MVRFDFFFSEVPDRVKSVDIFELFGSIIDMVEVVMVSDRT